MNQPLRILHLEDNADDSQLVRDMLREDGLGAEVSLASNLKEFKRLLEAGGWDLILADYRLPDGTGLEAMKLVRQKHANLPFVLLSGSLGEMLAIESLKAGATDYILKQNRDRLPSAVRRALAEAAERARRELAESELRRRGEEYRLLFHGNPHPMLVFDFKHRAILAVNEAAIAHYGFSEAEFVRLNLRDLRVQDRESQGDDSVWDEESRCVIWRHRRKDGRVRDMAVVWTPLVFQDQLAALALATDVTARRQTAGYNAVFSRLSHELSAVTSPATAARFISAAADELFPWDDFALDLYFAEQDQVVSLLNITTVEGRRVELPASPQPKTANALVRRVIARGAELLSNDRTCEQEGNTMLAPIRKGDYVIGLVFVQSHQPASYAPRDLQILQTLAVQCSGALERIRAEEELRHSQRRFRELFENSPDAIFVEDLQGKVLDANRSACALHGLRREQLVGKNALEDLVVPERREAARAEFARLAGGELSTVEGESQRADGRRVPVETRVVRVEFDGQPALLFHVRDLTDRRAAELALRSSETLFRSVWENSADGMRLTDQQGTIVAVNEAFCELVGMEARQLEGRPFTIVYAASMDWEELMRAHHERFRDQWLPAKRVRNRTLHDGRQVTFEISYSFVESGGQPRLLLSLLRDITMQKRLEEQFRQSQKMEAIGQLAGGVAHDFNNILTVILANAAILTSQPLSAKALSSARQIMEASERAAGLTRQLLAFGRKRLSSPKPVDLNHLVSQLSEMLKRLLGEDIELDIQLSPAPAIVEADAGMMEQVLMNLAVNSRDAMPRGGRLTISVTIGEVDENHASQFVGARPGRFVCLRHEDTGCGIPPENLARIFEPFFTTKELGKGTGLGLATAFGIVRQHNGWIEVESRLNQGTTFQVMLPPSNLTIAEAEKCETQFHARKGTETILVVEDERDLREIVTQTLNLNGYRVFQAVDGNKALQIWEEYKNDIDLIFTDVVMPGGLNGRELADRLLADKPGLKVIFTTGYDANVLDKGHKLDPQLNYLQKPYLPHDLARIVRRRLDENHAP